MGLDAFVSCNCLESGDLDIPSEFREFLRRDDRNARPYLDSPDREAVRRYSRWLAGHPCPHPRFEEMNIRLGNVHEIAQMHRHIARSTSTPAETYPVLWQQVVSSGTHDNAISPEDCVRLREEVKRLSSTRESCPDPEKEYFDYFLKELDAIAVVAIKNGRPIGF